MKGTIVWKMLVFFSKRDLAQAKITRKEKKNGFSD
jgi:hypothetical protein